MVITQGDALILRLQLLDDDGSVISGIGGGNISVTLERNGSAVATWTSADITFNDDEFICLMPKSATQNLDVDGYNVKIQVNGLVATVIDAVVINEEYIPQ